MRFIQIRKIIFLLIFASLLIYNNSYSQSNKSNEKKEESELSAGEYMDKREEERKKRREERIRKEQSGELELERQEQVKIAEQEKQQRLQKEEQDKAKRKQELTAKYGAANANKIMEGKFEIGMSKAICKEINSSSYVIDKTENAETWEIKHSYYDGARYIVRGYTHLYFNGDKLVRITRE